MMVGILVKKTAQFQARKRRIYPPIVTTWTAVSMDVIIPRYRLTMCPESDIRPLPSSITLDIPTAGGGDSATTAVRLLKLQAKAHVSNYLLWSLYAEYIYKTRPFQSCTYMVRCISYGILIRLLTSSI
jgi:hypothetical protein